MHTTAHMWRSEGNFWDLVIFHLSVAGSLLFLLLHCAPMIFRVILLSLPPISQQSAETADTCHDIQLCMGSGDYGQLSPSQVEPPLQPWFTLY